MKQKLLVIQTFGFVVLSLMSPGTYAKTEPEVVSSRNARWIGVGLSKLQDVLKGLKEHYSVEILFNDQQIQNLTIASGLVDYSKGIEQNLVVVLKETGLTFRKVRNKSFLIIPQRADKNSEASLNMEVNNTFSTSISPVTITTPIIDRIVSGRVIDSQKNEGLPGVSILVKGTTRGTTTNINGDFTLAIPDQSAALTFSFIGYLSQDVEPGNKSVLKVTLKLDDKQLNEVVVVGYGTQKKASVVGSIVQIGGEKLAGTGGVSNLAQALTGQLAGVTTMQSSGEPGKDDPLIYIRGKGTWNNSQPLILVDGIERRMNDIDMSEVENVSVLKDASATAVYGVKGAEGVILITTKKGKVGKPVITVEANFNTKQLSRVPQKFNSYDQFQFRNEVIEYQLNYGMGGQNTMWSQYMPQAVLQNYKQPQAPGMQYIFPDVDWVNAVTKPFPLSSRFNFNIAGGTEFAKYFGSLSYTYDDDIIKSGQDPMNAGYKSKNAYSRVNFRTNLDLQLTPSTVFSTNIAGYVGNKTQAYGGDGATLDIFKAYAELSPDMFPVYQADGSYGYNATIAQTVNPLLSANNRGVGERRRTNVTTDFVLKQQLDFITKGLSARASVSYDNTFYTDGGIQDGGQARSLYIDPAIIDIKEGEKPEDYMMGYIFNQAVNHDYDWVKGVPVQVAETSGFGSDSYRRLFYQGQVNYARTFGKHDVGALALINREKYAQGSMFPRYREDWVGRVTYGFADKYFLESNFAYNGSEKFGPGYRFGFFPSVAVGWNLAEERFIKQPWLDNLKVRYSIGKVGNDNFDSQRWAYQTNWALETARTKFGYPQATQSPYYQYTEQVIGNPDLSWETSLKQNLGLEVNVLSNKLGMTLDLFTDNRKNVFLNASQRTLAPYFGQKPVSANLGEVMVKGYEFEIHHRNTFKNKLGYSISINHTGAFDKVIYREDPPLLPDYQKAENFAINQIRSQLPSGFANNWNDVYSSTGYQTNNASKLPGDYRIIDFNGDGVIDTKDNTPWSYPIDRPQHTYNLTLGADYKGVSMSVQFYGIYNVLREYTGYIRVPFYNTLTSGPVITQHLDMWTPENEIKVRKCSEPEQKLKSLHQALGIKNRPFTKLKSVVHKPKPKIPQLAFNAKLSSA
jgi:TonB-linked SusC/RagA family outer membrane protein